MSMKRDHDAVDAVVGGAVGQDAASDASARRGLHLALDRSQPIEHALDVVVQVGVRRACW